jgi:hypothetical protein
LTFYLIHDKIIDDMELVRSTSRGGFSVRSIFAFVLTVVLAALLWALTATPVVNAQSDDTTADWNNNSILYKGNAYAPAGQAESGQSHGLTPGSNYYVYVADAEGAPSVRKAQVIYFAPGVSPPEATSAEYAEYDYSANQQFSNKRAIATIELTPRGEAETSETSCSVDGIGWIICPATVWLAEGMDFIFGLVSSFVAVPPAAINDSDSSLYVAWNVMRNIANVAFVIAFIFIIYSQLTGLGLDNYGLKKVLPRLVIAAILVNLSFYICAIAVDISNVLGFSLQDILIQIRQETFNITNDTWSGGTDEFTVDNTSGWTNIATVVLAGGVGFAGLAGATAGSIASLVYLIVPLLIGLLLTVLFVLLVLVARQAIIIILIIIAPLAFVAYLLPNTEKWFEKWKDLFMTMLIFFPAFSLVFGGSQLAGGIIVQNATSLVMMIFGMAVQVAPLVITPLLLRLSGSLLGRIAGIINDPRKGLLDRTRNWAGDRQEMYRQRSLATRGWRNYNPFRLAAKLSDNGNRRVKERTDLYKSENDNRYNRTRGHAKIHELQQGSAYEHERRENELKGHTQHLISTPGSRLNRAALEAENMKTYAEKQSEATDKMLNEYRAGGYDTGQIPGVFGINRNRMDKLRTQMAKNVIDTAALKQGTQNAQYEVQRNIANAMIGRGDLPTGVNIDTSQLLKYAQSIAGEAGRDRAQANAVAALGKMSKEARENVMTLLSDRAVSSGQTVKDYTTSILKPLIDKTATADDRNAILAQFSQSQIEAAFEIQAADGQVVVLDDARASEYVDQEMLDRVLDRNSGTMKAKGGFHLQANPRLSLQRYLADFNNGSRQYGETEADVRARFERDLQVSRLDSLSNTTASRLGDMKYGAFNLTANQFEGYLQSLDQSIADARADTSLTEDERAKKIRGYEDIAQKIHNTVQIALNDDGIYGSITDRLAETRNIDRLLSDRFGTKPVELREAETRRQGGEPNISRSTTPELPEVDPTAEHPTDTKK